MAKAVIYGIANCDTVRKARKWLEQKKIEHTFHDFRKDGLKKASIAGWLSQVDWESLLNKRSTTWRSLNDADKTGLDRTSAIQLMLENPTLIKRPVLVSGKEILVGFDPASYRKLFRQ